MIAICHYEEMNPAQIKEIVSFTGVKRRFSEKKWNKQVLVDDYAHHPKEIEATIEAARKKYPDKEIVAIFQPHTFSRTKTFLKEFGDSLSAADAIYLCDIFGSARETKADLSIEDLKELIPNSKVLELDEVEKLNNHASGVLVFMGAGDIQKYQDAYERIFI